MSRIVAVLGLAMAVAAGARAQEQEVSAPEESPTQPVRHIQVLQNPYDISSFYRSSQERSAGTFAPEAEPSGPYGIASFYRQRATSGRYGYSRFWISGYGQNRSGRIASSMGYRRSIGQNGDLYLFAPTVLAPVGPLMGVFNDGR
jgi:hypothetical protein